MGVVRSRKVGTVFYNKVKEISKRTFKCCKSGSPFDMFRGTVPYLWSLERDIRKRLVEVHDLEDDRLAEIITNTDDTRQMSEASRTLACVKPGGFISVHNESNQDIGSDREKAEVTRLFYKKLGVLMYLFRHLLAREGCSIIPSLSQRFRMQPAS